MKAVTTLRHGILLWLLDYLFMDLYAIHGALLGVWYAPPWMDRLIV